MALPTFRSAGGRPSGPGLSENEFDVVVVGSDPPGEVYAGRLGQTGLRVAIVERRLIGGWRSSGSPDLVTG